ncbi:MAG: hypothetical protein WD845_07595 [Pirellulales bacterium]
MLARCLSLTGMAVVAATLSGCCCEPWGGCYPNGMNWCGPSCGEKYWHEWFSLPPECCDPCDECGGYIGPRLNDGLYSHGNDYQGWCERRDAHRHAHYNAMPAEPIQGDPSPAPAPAPVDQPYYENGVDEMSYDAPPRSKYPGRRMSYQQPAPRGPRTAQRPSMQRPPAPRPSTQRPHTERLFSSLTEGPVDSHPASRTLARPPRTRLFSN